MDFVDFILDLLSVNTSSYGEPLTSKAEKRIRYLSIFFFFTGLVLFIIYVSLISPEFDYFDAFPFVVLGSLMSIMIMYVFLRKMGVFPLLTLADFLFFLGSTTLFVVGLFLIPQILKFVTHNQSLP